MTTLVEKEFGSLGPYPEWGNSGISVIRFNLALEGNRQRKSHILVIMRPVMPSMAMVKV